MKKLVLISAFLIYLLYGVNTYVCATKNDYYNNIIRLHIIANSDTDTDQALKLKVRNRIMNQAGSLFENAENAEKSEEIILKNLSIIEQIANDELLKNGSSMVATAEFGSFEFPTKVYENIRLPAGEYKAVRIKIGKGEGKNWWCVMYPPLCVVGVKTPCLENQEILKNNLTAEEFNIITSDNITVKFKLLEIWKK